MSPRDKKDLNVLASQHVAVGGPVFFSGEGIPSPWRSHVVYGG